MADETAVVSYEDLALIEDEFEQIDTEIIRKQYELSRGAYANRAKIISKIDHFWALVFEQGPLEIADCIQHEDSRIFAESLIDLEVTRPDLDPSKAGSPRSFHIKLTFEPNEFFEDTTLEKTFRYCRARDGWAGHVSEPVKIHWKKGKDLTEGLTDDAVALWAARKKAGDMTAKKLPEYTALKKKVEHWNGANTSFFTWFGWVSGRRWVSAEESAQAISLFKSKKDARSRGEKIADDDPTTEEEEREDDNDDSDVEVHQSGEDLAISIAEDLWPNAIKFFTQAQEMGDLSDVDFEEDDEDEDSGDDEPIDIRSLVQGKGKGSATSRQVNDGPPAKKQKK